MSRYFGVKLEFAKSRKKKIYIGIYICSYPKLILVVGLYNAKRQEFYILILIKKSGKNQIQISNFWPIYFLQALC